MSENGASQKIKDLGNTLMNNKGVRSIKKNLESGKIDINQLKKFAQSDDAKNLKNTAINTLLDVGQSYLNTARTKMNPPVKKESYHSWRDDFNPTEIESYDIIKAKPLGEGKKSCGKGEYFCRDEQKCKPIPKGTYVMKDGTLKKSKT